VAWVDAAKGISILLVVAHHVVDSLLVAGLAPPGLVPADVALAALRMPLFFLASGLFVAGPMSASWRTLLHRRVAFFLYLYLLWTAVRVAFYQVPALSAVDPTESADLAELAGAMLFPSSGLWFLYALALYSVVGKLLTGVPRWLQLAAAGTLSAFVGAELLLFENEAWTRMARYLFFFLLGWHARHAVQELARSTTGLRVVAAGAACMVCAAGAVLADVRSVPGIALALNVLAVTFGVLLAGWISRHRIGRPLVALGRQTLPIYLIHAFWISVTMVGLRHLGVPPAVAYGLPVVLAVVLTVLSLLTHRLLVRAGGTWLFALPSRLAPPAAVRS
jgi:uncharacterized membrane protein YcfT